jgi:hypothetical protein
MGLIMPEFSAVEYLKMLAIDVRECLSQTQEGNRVDDEGLQLLANSALSRLLGLWLAEFDSWTRFQWVDDIVPQEARKISDRELTLQGLMVWGEMKATQQWVEPLVGTFRLSGDRREIAFCSIMCGDSERGLRRNPYGHGALSGTPTKWIFEIAWPTPGTVEIN